MINKFVSFLTLVLISLSAIADHPKENIEKWLAKMHHAAHMINYDGTFVYGQNNEMTSMQIIHSVDKNGEFERLISLDGSGREVIRSGDTVTCIYRIKNQSLLIKVNLILNSLQLSLLRLNSCQNIMISILLIMEWLQVVVQKN